MIAKSSLRPVRCVIDSAGSISLSRFQALWREFVEPGERDPERKTYSCSDQKPARRPFRCADRRAQLRDALRQRPHSGDIEDHRADDIAPFQLGKKVA
jgi:hypothetical protein